MQTEAPQSPYMTTAELAVYIRRSVGAIHVMRSRGTAPKGTRVGREVLYNRADVDAWLNAKHGADIVRQRTA